MYKRQEEKPTKIRYPEVLGFGYLRPRKIRSWIRATMYSELSTDDEEQQRLGTLRCIAELQMKGYPNQVLKKMVAGITQRPLGRLRSVAQRYLRACKSTYGFGQMDVETVKEDMYDLHFQSWCRLEILKEDAKTTKQ